MPDDPAERPRIVQLALASFLLLSKDAFPQLTHISITAYDSHETLFDFWFD